MQKRRIGSLHVSVVGLGTNRFGQPMDADASARVVHAALDAGINLIDTADLYGATRSEEYIGRAIRDRRHEVVLATKFGWALDDHRRGARPEYIRRAAEDSLRRLGTDHIDLYQLHTPDPDVPIADTLGALGELIRAGQVREIGCSNFDVEQLRAAEQVKGPNAARFVSVQNDYSLFHREPERGVLDECARLNVAFLPFFPLASGLLTGKYRRGQPAPAGTRLAVSRHADDLLTAHNLDRVEDLIAFAEARGRTLLELAVSWLLSRSVVASVLAGATRPEQVKMNAAAGGWPLTDQELVEIDRIVGGVANV